MVTPKAAVAVVEKTLALIKPDAVKAKKAFEIFQLMEIEGFAITEKRQLTVSVCPFRGALQQRNSSRLSFGAIEQY